MVMGMVAGGGLQRIGVQAVVQGLSKYKSGAGDVQKANRAMGASAVTAAKKSDKLKAALVKMSIAGAAIFAAVSAAALVAGFKMAATLEKAELQFESLLGSADKAKKHVAGLFEFAAKTPFETEPIIQASRMLLTFGKEALATTENLKLVGDAAAITGQSIDQVAFWFGRAYALLQGGKPFGEAAMRLMEMGILTAEGRMQLEDLMATGASTEEVWARLVEEFARFDGAMIKQAATWGGLTSTIKDNLEIAASEGVKPFFDAVKEMMTAMAEFVQTKEFAQFAQDTAAVLQMVVKLMKLLLGVLGEAAGGFKILTGAVFENKAAMAVLAVVLGTVLAMRMAHVIVGLFGMIRAFGLAATAALYFQSTLGPLGLGLAIVGTVGGLVFLNRMLGNHEDAADAAAAANERLSVALHDVAMEASRRGLDPLTEQLREIGQRYEANLVKIEETKAAMAKLAEIRGPGKFEALREIKELEQTLKDTEAAQEALGQQSRELINDYDKLTEAIGAGVISFEDAVKLLPGYRDYLLDVGEVASSASVKLEEMATIQKELANAVDEATGALSEEDAILRKLAGTMTEEEQQLKAVVAAIDLQIAELKVAINAQGEATDEQERQLKVLKQAKSGVEDNITLLQAKKTADLESAAAVLTGRMSMEEWDEAMKDASKGLTEGTFWTYQLKEGLGLLRSNVEDLAFSMKDGIFTVNGSFVRGLMVMNKVLDNTDPSKKTKDFQKWQKELLAELLAMADAAVDFSDAAGGTAEATKDLAEIMKDLAEQYGLSIDTLSHFPDILDWATAAAQRLGLTTETLAQAFKVSGVSFDQFVRRLAASEAMQELAEEAGEARDALQQLYATMSALYGQPTKGEAQLTRRLAELRYERARLLAIGAGEGRIGKVDTEIDKLQKLLDLRRQEGELMRARLDAENKGLLTDAERQSQALDLIRDMGDLSVVTAEVVDRYYDQREAMSEWTAQLRDWISAMSTMPMPGAFAGEYQHGGTVPGPLGSPQMAIVHGGERVFQPSQWINTPALSGVSGGSTEFAPVFNVQGATLEEMVSVIHGAVDEFFADARSRVSRQGTAFTSGIGS